MLRLSLVVCLGGSSKVLSKEKATHTRYTQNSKQRKRNIYKKGRMENGEKGTGVPKIEEK